MYPSLQKNDGFFELSTKLLKVTGEKASQLLHGQLTNTINALQSNQGNYNLLLTLKGKVVADLFVYRVDHDYYLLVNAPSYQKVFDHLKKFAPFSKVTVTDETDKYTLIHLCSKIECKKYHFCETKIGNVPVFCFRSDRLGVPGCDLIVDKNKKEEVISSLKDQKCLLLDENLREMIRVEQGIPKIGIDFTEANLPQEARLDHALNFEKGCYLGQEIIARLHYRGHVNKILVGLKIESEKPVGRETPIFDKEKEIGRITSSIFSPKLNTSLALGYIPYALNQAGNEFQIGEKKIKAQIIELP